MDLLWTIEENMCAYRGGRAEPRAAVNGILNGIAMMETIAQYTKAKEAIHEICKDIPELCEATCKMMQNLIEDEANHDASVKKAAALFMGMKPPKPTDFKE